MYAKEVDMAESSGRRGLLSSEDWNGDGDRASMTTETAVASRAHDRAASGETGATKASRSSCNDYDDDENVSGHGARRRSSDDSDGWQDNDLEGRGTAVSFEAAAAETKLPPKQEEVVVQNEDLGLDDADVEKALSSLPSSATPPAERDSGHSNGTRTARRSLGHSISMHFSRKRKAKKPKSSSLNERSRKEYSIVLLAGMCLAFNSGYLNGSCLSGILPSSSRTDGDGGMSVSVSAFTGSYTNSALFLAKGDVESFGFLLSMILCFIGGAFLTAVINPRPKPYELGPEYGPTFLLGSTFLVASSALSEFRPDTKGMFYFAAAANGLQNGMSSIYSCNLIRSSHYTGTSTDIGLILGQVVRGNRTSLWKLWVLLGLTFSFWTGGVVSFYATTHFRTHSLIFNAAFFFLIGCGLIAFVAHINRVSLWQAAFGTWHWERALESLVSARHMDGGGASPLGNSIRGSIRHSRTGKVPTEECLLNLFDEIDIDKSGHIEDKELYIALRAAGMKIERKGIDAMMKLADVDGDGMISRQEWEMLITGNIVRDGINAATAARKKTKVEKAAEKAAKKVVRLEVKKRTECKRENERNGVVVTKEEDLEAGMGRATSLDVGERDMINEEKKEDCVYQCTR